jgi:hypothetical protein
VPVKAADRRLTLGVAAVISVAEAAALLPFADAEARRWLQAQGLVRELAGRRVVRWLDVVFHPDLGGVPTEAGAMPPPPPAPRARLARTPLPPLKRAAGADRTRSDRNTDKP